MVASNAEASVAANGLRDNVIACAGGENTKEENDKILNTETATAVVQNTHDSDDTIGARRKRSGNDLTGCCNELRVSITAALDVPDTVKSIHREWGRNSYFLQNQMSDADRLVYKSNAAYSFQTPRPSQDRYLYIRRQSNN